MFKDVYHSTHVQHLQIIKPRYGSHQKECVYAAKDIVMSAVFITGIKGGDFVYAKGRDPVTKKVYICERFAGAFDKLYKNVTGSIYVLPGATFKEGLTGFDEEVVSELPVNPLKEISINDMLAYLTTLAEQNNLVMKYYPERIDDIPSDDEDLVYRAVIWTKQFGDYILERIKEYHPALYPIVMKILGSEEEFVDRAKLWINRFGYEDFIIDALKNDFPHIYNKIGAIK